MTKIEETIQKAYGGIPREPVVVLDLFTWIPTQRGVKYYWIKFKRFFTR